MSLQRVDLRQERPVVRTRRPVWLYPDFNQDIHQNLNITQSVAIKKPDQNVSQSLTIIQSVDRPGDFAHSASNSLNIIQAADYFKFKPISISQSLTIAQSESDVLTMGLSDSLTISQTPAYQYNPHSEFLTQFVAPAQSVDRVVIFDRRLNQTLTITQTIAKTKIITRAVSQHLVIIHDAVREAKTTINQALTIAQTIVVDIFRNQSKSQSLNIAQSVSVQTILNLAVENILIFTHNHYIPDGSGNFLSVPNLIYTRGGITNGNCSCVFPSRTTVYQSTTRAIVLPNPEFGDTQANVSAVRVTRTITGQTYSYVKKSAARQLKYKFHVSRSKAEELRRFLLDFLTQRITLTTWKGEIYNGNFTSDPVEITAIERGDAPKGDLYEVELDFQGVKVN